MLGQREHREKVPLQRYLRPGGRAAEDIVKRFPICSGDGGIAGEDGFLGGEFQIVQ